MCCIASIAPAGLYSWNKFRKLTKTIKSRMPDHLSETSLACDHQRMPVEKAWQNKPPYQEDASLEASNTLHTLQGSTSAPKKAKLSGYWHGGGWKGIPATMEKFLHILMSILQKTTSHNAPTWRFLIMQDDLSLRKVRWTGRALKLEATLRPAWPDNSGPEAVLRLDNA